MSPAISAVVCTHNRAAYLERALASLAAQSLARDAYEILVVDNASTDDTPAVVAAARARIPNLVALHEPTPGLGHARNAGLRAARGAYVAYVDDDAVASPAWLARILAAFATVQPAPGCVGGRVDAIWEAPRPGWLADELLPYLTVIDWSPTATFLGEDRFVAGANMAFPRDLLRAIDGFHPALGRRGTNLLSNDELRVEATLRRRGHPCWYDPAIAVGHHVSPERLTRGYFRRRCFWQGVSDAQLVLLDAAPSARERGVRLARQLRRAFGPRACLRLLGGATGAERFRRRCEALRELGFTGGLLAARLR